MKNKTKIFKQALDEAKSEMSVESRNSVDATPLNTITLKNETIQQILHSFDENKHFLESIFNDRKATLNRFNVGNGYDFLTILWRVVSTEQQQAMYSHILNYFTHDEREYIQDPKVSDNIFVFVIECKCFQIYY